MYTHYFGIWCGETVHKLELKIQNSGGHLSISFKNTLIE